MSRTLLANPIILYFNSQQNEGLQAMYARVSAACLSCCRSLEYCEGINRCTGVNCFWIINNSTDVLRKLGSIHHARSMNTFDFNTHYTNIPNDMLKTHIKSLIEKAYRCRGAIYIRVDKYAQWSNDVSCCAW